MLNVRYSTRFKKESTRSKSGCLISTFLRYHSPLSSVSPFIRRSHKFPATHVPPQWPTEENHLSAPKPIISIHIKQEDTMTPLSQYEQETVVNYNAGEQTATLYTTIL